LVAYKHNPLQVSGFLTTVPDECNVMQTKGFAMIRKIMLAALCAILLSAGLPAWAASSEALSAGGANDTTLAAPYSGSQDLSASMGSDSSDALANFGPTSGTVVGNRSIELRDEVLRLRSSVSLNAHEFSLLRANGAAGAVQYHSTVAAITARLQNGTTRGNPILLRQWDEAEASLNEVTNSLDRLNALQTSVAADASLAAYMLESVQAGFLLSGAVDEDHDQLKLLRDEVSRLVVQLDYLRNQVADDLQRQTNYLTTERSNLQTLAFAITRGELLGNSLANRPVIVNPSPVMMLPQAGSSGSSSSGAFAPAPNAAPSSPVTPGNLSSLGPTPMSPRSFMEETGQPIPQQASLPTGDAATAPSTGRLLALVRYNQADVDYHQQLSTAVSMALQRKSDLQFSVIAVTPSRGDPSEIATQQESVTRHAEDIKQSLVQMGLSPSRITVASTQMDVQVPEVHVYIR